MDDRDREVYEKLADELTRFAVVLVGPSQAEDVVADAAIGVFRSPGWPSVSDQRAYLMRAVFRRAMSARRSELRLAARELRAAALVTDPIEPTKRIEVVDALARLTLRQRAVVFHRYWLDLDTTEIAAGLGLSVRTVQRELRSAHDQLRRTL